MKKIIIAIALIIVFLFTFSVYAGETIYSKPEFRGRVIDADTKQPIEGAVVVVLYYKRPILSGPGGPNSYVFRAREILTDSKGEFYFPSYTSLILFTEDAGVNFIFYKPGYMASYGPTDVNPNLREQYFATDTIGKEAVIKEGSYERGVINTWEGPLGILELQKVSPDKAMPPGGIPADYGAYQLPLLYKAINADRRNRGLKGEVE